jgi:hypothetical protein
MKRLLDSPSVSKYKKTFGFQWSNKELIDRFKNHCNNKPIIVGFHFIRDSARKYDFINALQLPLDLMRDNGWIIDDNINEILPIPLLINGKFTTINRENAGVIIKISNDE